MTNLSNLLAPILLNAPMASENSFCHQLWLNSISGIIAIAGIALAAVLAYRFAIKQKKQEIFIGLEKIKYERKLAALEACWKLLAFTTDTENEQCILIWEEDKADKSKTYSINTDNAREFMKGLTACFYHTGLGIYLSQDIKKLLFEYRGMMYGFLLSTRNSKEKVVTVTNANMHKRMTAIHHELIVQLKAETEGIDKQD